MFCDHENVMEVTRCGDSYRHFKCLDCGFEFVEPFMDMDEDAEE